MFVFLRFGCTCYFVSLFSVDSTSSAIDCLERRVSEVTECSGMGGKTLLPEADPGF